MSDKYIIRGVKVVKRIWILCVLIFVAINFSSCEKESKEKIINYWVSSDLKSTLAFDENGNVVIDDKYMGNYSIYAEDKIAINVDTEMFDDVYDVDLTAKFDIDDDILCITDMDDGSVYLYYLEEKAEKLINKEYWTRSVRYSVEQYMAIPIAYAEKEWELHLEGTELEGVTTEEKLKKDSITVKEIVEEQILMLYQESIINGRNVIEYSCERAVYIWDTVYYEIIIKNSESEEIMDIYAVNAENGDIYVEDEEGFYVIWEGTLKGNSILKEIEL